MQKKHPVSQTQKTLPALFAALSMTVFIGVAILAFGLNALSNQNVNVTQAAAQPDSQVVVDQATIQDLQATISQYQAREVQYQSELQKAADQISQQNLQYQQLTQSLQNAGVIQITPDGQVFITRGAEVRSGFGDDDD